MVLKTSHRGVHSGNTLRASNSRYSRRYHAQSCIVSRIRPELLKKLVQGGDRKADDTKTMPKLRNVAANVPLSLNKQSRWVLPSALIRQIQSNDIADSQLTVSVVERHKLKQRACCVSFHSNKGEVKRIQPGRYFGFSHPRTDGKSQRALRRERREELSKLLEDPNGKTVEVYTEQGQQSKTHLGDSEVRYEVYYPCPASSSIAHNPKYIRRAVNAAPGEPDEHVQHGRPKKQHRGKQRKRMSLKDLDVCDLPSFQPAAADLPLVAFPDNEEPAPVEEDIKEKENTTECLLTTLIEKAQRLQNFKGVAKPRHRKRSDKSAAYHEDDKSHIVYVSGPDAAPSLVQNSVHSSPLVYPVPPAPAESSRVMLPKDDVTMASLKDCFEQNYFEAACKPRKFVLDITMNVQDVLKKLEIPARVAEKSSDTYLICVHDGIYDDEYDVYKALLNSRLHEGVLPVQINNDNQDLYRGTVMSLVSRTMDFVESLVTKLKDKNHFSAFLQDTVKHVKTSERRLNGHLGSAEAYVPSVQRLFQKGSDVSGIAMPSLSDLLQEDSVFCEVCYEDISPTTMDSAACTSLLKCGHQVCDDCWSRHIHTRLGEGFVRLPCPGHDCQQEVKLGVLLSLVPLSAVEKLLQRQEEVRISGSSSEKWCPNPACGRVIRLLGSSAATMDTPQQQDVVCGCGGHVCFQCLAPAHWPASCQQAQNYRSNLDTAVFPDRLAEVHDDSDHEQEARLQRELQQKSTMLVEGKHCPNCKSFVLKNGGCPQMTCRCGQLFCWYCAKPGFAHLTRKGCASVNREKALTTTLVVRHLEEDRTSEAAKKENQAPAVNKSQRTSLLERAAEHHRHHQSRQQSLRSITTLANKVASAAAKDTVLTQHILQASTEAFPSSSCCQPSAESPVSGSAPHTQVPVLEAVTAFLKSAARSKRELHQVVEYSLVLLKDLPDSLLRRRALRISEDLGAFCSFSQSVFDAWSGSSNGGSQGSPQAVKSVMRLAEIQGWVCSALDAHIVTVRKLRGLRSPPLPV